MTAILLDRFSGRLHLEGTLTTWTALHIGAGGSADALGSDAPVVRTGAGLPYIPGSSLKGVLRSAAEALFRTLPKTDDGSGLWACSTFGEDACGTHKKVKELRDGLAKPNQGEVPSRELAEKVWAESCWICRLFGSMALASRVRFADLLPRGTAPLPEKRNGVGIDRDKELAASGVLYDFEAVPPETQFELRVVMDNPTPEEAGLLLYLFEELSSGNLTLGGKTSRGLGRVRVNWERIEEIRLEKQNPFSRLLSNRDLLAPPPAASVEPIPASETTVPQYRFAGKLPLTGDPEAWRTLAEILEEMHEVDEAKLIDRAPAKGLAKKTINAKLGLGLEEGQFRRAWDIALERLVLSGFLVPEGDKLYVARDQPDAAEQEATSEPPRSAAMQSVIDTYVGALEELWRRVA
jgi:CRISPR-associated RAMP protein (TIGR02581 family)